jgi:transglutaminase-like putative cysteine protease
MSNRKIFLAALLAVCTVAAAAGATAEEQVAAKSRRFEFSYAAEIRNVSAGENVRVWMPIPPTTADQTVVLTKADFPAEASKQREAKFGNEMYYFETKSELGKPIKFAVSYHIERKAVSGLSRPAATAPAPLADEDLRVFLKEDRKVPISGRPLELIKGFSFPESRIKEAKLLYDAVEEYLSYDKSKPGYGEGDVLWVCESRAGNCTDFHSLFMSLARSRGIPAKFQIGFPLPDERGSGTIKGYHCWAQFYDKQLGWIPVDISEADKHPELKAFYFGNLTENRVEFTTGRDIDLVPRQQGESLNFFVYPYVEVSGKAWGRDDVELSFGYKDQQN